MARIETLMLANHAESVNGLLYVHGGGWSHHWRGAEPTHPSQFAVAATVLLDAGEGPNGVPFTILVRSETGEEVLRAEGVLQGPAAQMGEGVRTGIAVNANVVFPHEGPYTLTAEIAGAQGPSVAFWVHDRASDAGSPEPDPGQTAGYL
jgi:hypothetical protein